MIVRNFVKTISLFLGTALSVSVALAQPVAKSADLFAGNPSYEEPKDRARDGQTLLADPPLAWRTLLFVGDKLVTAVGQEIWYTDLKSATPTIKRIAGVEDLKGQALRPGSGAQARFANISGLALLPDGTIVGADQTGNCIFEVSDPLGPNCKVALLAGTTQAQDSVSPGAPPNVGDIDGPGSAAKFNLVEWPAVVSDTVYFIDEGKCKLKKMTNDPAHTVSTVAKLPSDGIYSAMITLNGKLYILANNSSSEGFILEVDPGTGAIREVIKGRSDAFEGDGAINVSGLATDGTGLFTSQSGQIVYVSLDGKTKAIAGNGNYFEFQGAYDPKKAQKPDKVQLVTMRRSQTAGSHVFMAYKDKTLYFCAIDTTQYVEAIHFN